MIPAPSTLPLGKELAPHKSFPLRITLLQAAIFSLSSACALGQSPVMQVRADAQTKIYGSADPAFTFQYHGFTNGDTASALSGQPVISAPQQVKNLWEFTEDPASPTYYIFQFHADGTLQQWNGINLSHITSSGSYYDSISSPFNAIPSPIVYPGVQYLLSFYASSNLSGTQLYWHRYLQGTTSEGWGPSAIGQTTRRVVFSCAGTAAATLDCGNDPTVPLGSGAGTDRLFWLFMAHNNAFGDASAANFQGIGPADLYFGGFQVEPTVTQKRGVVAMGDSLTQYDCTAVDPAGCTSWTALASSLLNVPFYDRGIGGQTCAQILARWPTDASPILAANASYVIIECGTNDIGVPLSATQIEQSISSMYSLAMADGATPVVVTIGPFRTTVAINAAEATRQSVNAWIRSTFPFVLDFDKVNADPNNPRLQNPAYIGDGTHLNLAGRIAEGNYVAQSVAGNTQGYPGIWNFNAPIPYQPVLATNSSNGMDFKPGAQREVGSYIILPSVGTLTSNKYQFSFNSALLSVTPAPLQVTANDKTINYGDPSPALDGTLIGALPADRISVQFTTTATASSGLGQFPITPVLVDRQNRLSNYNVTQKPATLTVLETNSAAPTFSLPAGTYHPARSVSIIDSTPGAVIYYTTDGTPPTSSSPAYVGPVTVSATGSLQAIAVAPNYFPSTVSAASYTIVPLPAIGSLSPPFTSAGASGLTLTVSGTDFDPSATVYWGSSPLVTQFVSSTSLSAQVTASDTAQRGIAAVTVHTTVAGGGSSSKFQLEIDSSAGSVSPPVFTTAAATVIAGATATYPVTLPAAVSNATASCLNLPMAANCSYQSSTGTVNIVTSPTTPAGSYPIVVVFTETLPGVASAWIGFPAILIFCFGSKKKRLTRPIAIILSLILATMALGTMGGCGGSGSSPQTHQVTSSGVVVLKVQ